MGSENSFTLAYKVDADYIPKEYRVKHYGDRIVIVICPKTGRSINRLTASRGEQWFKNFDAAIAFAHHAINANKYMSQTAKDAMHYRLDKYEAERRISENRKTSAER